MSRQLLARRPVARLRIDYFVLNIVTGSWTEILSATTQPFDAVEIFSATASIIELSTGELGQENSSIVPYYILPGGSGILLPYNLKKGARLSARAVDTAALKGNLILNFFG